MRSAILLALAGALAAEGPGDPRVWAKVQSLDSGDHEFRVELEGPVCTLRPGDSVPVYTHVAHDAAPGDRVYLKVTYKYLGEGVVDCVCHEGRLVVQVLDRRRR